MHPNYQPFACYNRYLLPKTLEYFAFIKLTVIQKSKKKY
jgi:hypothetical protein